MGLSSNIIIGTFLYLFFVPSFFVYSIFARRRKYFWKDSNIKGTFFSNKWQFLEKFLFCIPSLAWPLTCNNCFFLLSILEIVGDFCRFSQSATSDFFRYLFLPVQSAVGTGGKKKVFFHTFFFKFSVRIYTMLIFCLASSKEKRICGRVFFFRGRGAFAIGVFPSVAPSKLGILIFNKR